MDDVPTRGGHGANDGGYCSMLFVPLRSVVHRQAPTYIGFGHAPETQRAQAATQSTGQGHGVDDVKNLFEAWHGAKRGTAPDEAQERKQTKLARSSWANDKHGRHHSAGGALQEMNG